MFRNSILLMLLLATGLVLCQPVNAAVRRRITIKTSPPGALVYIDDQEIGVTPVSTSFTYCLLYTSPSPRDQRGSGYAA